jgi:hypothetical protein
LSPLTLALLTTFRTCAWYICIHVSHVPCMQSAYVSIRQHTSAYVSISQHQL